MIYMIRGLGAIGGAERGASSVIGTILMVAVVVVVAASTGAYLLDAGDGVVESPQAAFSGDYVRDATGDGYTLAVTHDGGDGLDASALRVEVEGAWSRDTANADDNERAGYVADDALETAVGDRFESGETVRFDRTHFEETVQETPIDDTDYLDLDAATVRLVWSASDSDTAYVLWEWEGPSV